ncbi:MAG TPA: FtsX-like permease family protein [Gemmataceae bacterium]|nr:FtsX-like permease family protein [Gemmataceae bacterium]
MLSLFSLFRTFSRRYLGRRFDRAGLIVLIIAAGVTMLVSTRLLNDCLESAVHSSTALGADQADLLVTNDRRVRIDLASKLRAVPGVQAVQPLIFDRVILPEFNNQTAIFLGVDVQGGNAESKDSFVEAVTVSDPLALVTGRGVLIGDELAKVLSPDGKPTKPFEIRAGGHSHRIQPAGTVKLKGQAAKLSGFLIATEIRAASKMLNQDGVCDRIDLKLSPGADKEQVRAAAQAIVGEQGQVKAPEMASKATAEIAAGVHIGFILMGVGAMVVGLFLIYIVLAVSVAERRHDIGVLRSLGATRPQIAALFTGEAVVMGLVGALLGVPIGWGLAKFTFSVMKQDMEQVFFGSGEGLQLTVPIVLIAVCSGVVTAGLAALVPAMQAASDEPADAVRRVPSAASRFFRYLQALASLAVIGAGFGCIAFRHQLPPQWGGIGGVVAMMVGVLLAVPLMVAVLSHLAQPLFRRLFGIEARLASDNLLRAPGRTGIVVGVLAAGVTLMLQTAGIGRSNEGPILAWLDRVATADMFIICGDPNASSSAMLPMDITVRDEIRKIPGVQQTMTLRFSESEFNGRLILLISVDAVDYYHAHEHSRNLPDLSLFLQLPEKNTCIVSENFAVLNHVKKGDTIELHGPNGPVPLHILGVIPDYHWSRGSIYVDRDFYKDAFQDPLIDTCHAFLKKDGHEEETRARVKKFCDSRALVVLNRQDIDVWTASFLRRLYFLSYLQQMVVGIVAALGVVMALLISVLQRRRELGLLRAVGATQSQVLYTVLAEATLMGIFGTILGLLGGIPLEWYLMRIVIYEESGLLFPVTVPWKETLILSGLAIATATLAGMMPAYHAARLRIAEAIAYE